VSIDDGLQLFLAILIVAAVAFDWWVYGLVQDTARVVPRIPTLDIAAWRSLGIAIGISIAAVVAIHVVILVVYDYRVLPQIAVPLLLGLAILAPTLGNIPTVRQVLRWRKAARKRLDVEPRRRWNDPT
jgi:hypothetical protein